MAKKTDASAAGCLASLFTILGTFLFGSAIFSQFQSFSGDGFGFDLNGGVIPGLVLLAMGGSLRRKAKAAKPDEGQVRIPLKTPPQSPQPQQTQTSKPKPKPPTTPPRTTPPQTAPQTTPPQTTPPEVLIPGLSGVEETPEPVALRAIEELSLEDFEPDRPMTSDERLRIAKEKYQRKP